MKRKQKRKQKGNPFVNYEVGEECKGGKKEKETVNYMEGGENKIERNRFETDGGNK
jgi:hypothetical protein